MGGWGCGGKSCRGEKLSGGSSGELLHGMWLLWGLTWVSGGLEAPG